MLNCLSHNVRYKLINRVLIRDVLTTELLVFVKNMLVTFGS